MLSGTPGGPLFSQITAIKDYTARDGMTASTRIVDTQSSA